MQITYAPKCWQSWQTQYRVVAKVLLLLGVLLLSGCTPRPPHNINNVCAIFQQYPRWYWDALDSYRRWGVPISIQMAIIRQESHFRGDAAPPRTKLLGFIPWKRPTSAYGYAQAIDGTWKHYMKSTGNTRNSRTRFADATNFIGWFAQQANKEIGLPKHNAYELYLAFHEGISGYMKKTQNTKPWLIKVAKKVQHNANIYRGQIARCKDKIPKPSIWNLWLW